MRQAELIFVPAPGIGHLVAAIEFSKRLINRDDRISITILVMELPFSSFIGSYTKSLTASQPRIQLIDLPQVEPPPQSLWQISIESYVSAFIERQIPNVKNVVSNILTSSSHSSTGSVRVAGLVLDLFCVSMIDVANEFGLPSYIFLTCNAAFLDLMLYLPTRHNHITTKFEKTDPEILMPGFANPVPPCVLPGSLFTKEGYDTYIKLAPRFKDVKGIMVNTFFELETYTINSFLHAQNPPVYSVGPVLELKGQPHPDKKQAECEKIMKWLDDQPQSSVVFLCFGSLGSFDAPQVKEIALAVEHSGYKFLWSMRMPPPKNDGTSHYTTPEDMLPEGFLERIKGRGMICGWAPQIEVLAHKAIGGFVSHAGWNSILESLWFGVPIVTWPIYAEQQLNAFKMVRELELAVELKLDYRWGDSDLVMADEIEKAVRCLMDGDNVVRKKVKDMAKMARKAVMDGGSSFNSIGSLIEDMIGSN